LLEHFTTAKPRWQRYVRFWGTSGSAGSTLETSKMTHLGSGLCIATVGANPIGLKCPSRIGPRRKLSGRDDVNDEVNRET